MKRLHHPAVAIGLVLLALGVLSCNKGTKVGSEELLNIKEQKQQERLGQILNSPPPEAQAAQSPAALGASPPPERREQQPGPQAPQKQVLELTLINDYPYIQPRPDNAVVVGTTIRLINKDDNPRRYKSVDGTYDSGDIAPGRTAEFVANIRGDFSIEDPNMPFVAGLASLRVS